MPSALIFSQSVRNSSHVLAPPSPFREQRLFVPPASKPVSLGDSDRAVDRDHVQIGWGKQIAVVRPASSPVHRGIEQRREVLNSPLCAASKSVNSPMLGSTQSAVCRRSG
jgi:hypothetical protein